MLINNKVGSKLSFKFYLNNFVEKGTYITQDVYLYLRVQTVEDEGI